MLRDFFERQKDPVFVIFEGKIIFSNKEAERLLPSDAALSDGLQSKLFKKYFDQDMLE